MVLSLHHGSANCDSKFLTMCMEVETTYGCDHQTFDRVPCESKKWKRTKQILLEDDVSGRIVCRDQYDGCEKEQEVWNSKSRGTSGT
jgi:hypothetical protein